ncbi:hypothetical protein [Sphingomonas sp. VDB2]|uniref:hypothetical protein n=1 Tax=Sphingomonas sp. VDB2 TaxID=3228751 RepID=UPI003A80CE16
MPERQLLCVPNGEFLQVRTVRSQLQKLHPWRGTAISVAESRRMAWWNSSDIRRHVPLELLRRLTL